MRKPISGIICCLLLVICILMLCTCKKYPEGGFVYQTRLHLFGGHKNGDSKTWKLKLYEVNGIDSTNLIQGANDLSMYNITFNLTDKKNSQFIAHTFLNNYVGTVDKLKKTLAIQLNVSKLTKEDSTQCKNINSVPFCVRNIFLPEFNFNTWNYGKLWNIKKLTKRELELETNINLKNSYKIIFTQ